MGILFVLAFYLVALSVLAVICSLSLMFRVSRYFKRKHIQDKAAIRRTGLFPFACVTYAGVWFIVYAAINGFVLHRDPMVGDEWTTPIGDGYSITMIDITDQAILYPTDTDINSSSAIQSVRSLQIVGTEIIGVRDVDSHDRFGSATKAGDGFLAVYTKSHSISKSSSQKLLFDYASQKGVELKVIADQHGLQPTSLRMVRLAKLDSVDRSAGGSFYFDGSLVRKARSDRIYCSCKRRFTWGMTSRKQITPVSCSDHFASPQVARSRVPG